jgi:hypothetical protein
MAKKNNNTLLIVAVAAAGFYLWKRSSAAAVVAPVATGTMSTSPVTLGTGSAATPAPAVASDPRLTEIRQWIASLSAGNQSAANAALLVMTQSEIDKLYDIVHNDFYGNGITTILQAAFWNGWRQKYHVLDGTYP